MKVTAKVYPTEGNTNVAAMATVKINDEIVLHNVRLVNGTNGLFVQMPATKVNGTFKDIFFPITVEARKQINDEVIARYNQPATSRDLEVIGRYETDNGIPDDQRITEYSLKYDAHFIKHEISASGLYNTLASAEEYYRNIGVDTKEFIRQNAKEEAAASSKITASLKPVTDKGNVKAVGQITIDDSLAITGVKVIESEKGLFASMPSYTNQYNEWKDYANPVTKEAFDRIQTAVLNKYRSLGTVQGNVKYSEIGDKADIRHTNGLDNGYAKIFIDKLEAAGIKYSAKVGEKSTAIAFHKDNAGAVKKLGDEAREEFKAAKSAAAEAEMPPVPEEAPPEEFEPEM